MNRRWYDMEPTVSMAVSFLQNTEPDHRETTTSHFLKYLQSNYPELIRHHFHPSNGGFWSVIQKRKTMGKSTWALVELLRYLPQEEKERLALEMIRFIYCLEHDESIEDFDLSMQMDIKAAV